MKPPMNTDGHGFVGSALAAAFTGPSTGVGRRLFVFLSYLVLCGAAWAGPPEFRVGEEEKGRVVGKATAHGEYRQYVPRSVGPQFGTAVLVHGMLGRNEEAGEVAERFIRRWIPAAERRGIILLAPAFDQENFGGHRGPGGGYRGLFGREIGADEFVNEIVDRYKQVSGKYDGRFYLYGHSAGGQFVSRYVVRHPERVVAAVISAAGTYAFPNPEVPWTNGMAPLVRSMQWHGTDDVQHIDIQPDPQGWVKAATLPIVVVVGSHDVEALKGIAGQKGGTRLERARHWVQDMNESARRHDQEGRVRLVVVTGPGHNSAQLTPTCVQHLFGR